MNPTSRARRLGVIGLDDRAAPPRRPAQHDGFPPVGKLPRDDVARAARPARQSAAATRADRARRSSIVSRVSPSTIASRAPSTRGEPIEQRLVGPDAERAPLGLHLGRRRVRARHCVPYTGAGAGAFASSSRTAGADVGRFPARAAGRRCGPCCQPSATEIMPPSTSNTRPVTSRDSALPSHTTSGEMLRGVVGVEAGVGRLPCARRTPLRSCACAPRARSRSR